jgi:hypothetical protein
LISKKMKSNTILSLKNRKKKTIQVAHAHKNLETQIAQNMDSQQYTFSIEKGDALAIFDAAGGAQQFFLPEFVDYFEQTVPGNWENIVIELFIGVLIHEDVHRCISESGIESQNEYLEHQIMEKIFRP